MQDSRSFTQNEIENAKQYKYSGTDDSILAKLFLRTFWNWLIEFFPMTIAANTITFIGFMFEFISFAISYFLSDSFQEEIPSWAIFLNGLCLFIYQTLDNLDGRQARRTGTSSPLGQFFDHGCDALTGVFIMSQVIMTINLGNCLSSFLCIFVMGIGFALTSWEEYVTHSFHLGPINAPDEGLFLLSIFHVFVSIFRGSMSFFRSPFVQILYLIGALSSIVPIIVNVVRQSIYDNEKRNRALISIAPLLISIVLSIAMVFRYPDSCENTFVLLFCGFLVQYQSQLMIVSYLVKRPPLRLFDPTLYPAWIFLAAGLLFPRVLLDSWYLWGFLTICEIGVIIYFDIGVIQGLSEGLNIPVFSVPLKNQEDEQDNRLNIEVEEDKLDGNGEFNTPAEDFKEIDQNE